MKRQQSRGDTMEKKFVYFLIENTEACAIIYRAAIRGRCKLKSSINIEEAYTESKKYLEEVLYPAYLAQMDEGFLEIIDDYIRSVLEKEADKIADKN
jgi:hypothetical protein